MARLYQIVLVIVIGLVLAAGCGPPKEAARVVIEYKQLANFSYYVWEPGAITWSAGPSIYIMYKLTQIKNTGSPAKTFSWITPEISTLAPDQTSNETPFPDGKFLEGWDIVTGTVDAGETKSINRCFIKRAMTSNPKSLVSAQVPLVYSSDTNQPVTMTNVAPTASVAAVGTTQDEPVLRTALQSLCASK